MSKQVQDAYIVAATRSPVGKAPRGMFRNVRPDDLLAHVLKAALDQCKGIDPHAIDDVIVGCAMPEAEQGLMTGIQLANLLFAGAAFATPIRTRLADRIRPLNHLDRFGLSPGPPKTIGDRLKVCHEAGRVSLALEPERAEKMMGAELQHPKTGASMTGQSAFRSTPRSAAFFPRALDGRQHGCYAAAMVLLDRPAAALAWFGRHGTIAVAASMFVGIALPPLGALIRPYFAEKIGRAHV